MNAQKTQEKLTRLIRDKEKVMNFVTLEVIESEDGDAHILAKRDSDGTYIVWTAHDTGEESTSYAGLFNGKYDMSLSAGVAELLKRTNREFI